MIYTRIIEEPKRWINDTDNVWILGERLSHIQCVGMIILSAANLCEMRYLLYSAQASKAEIFVTIFNKKNWASKYL